MLDLQAQYASIREEIHAALDEVLASQQFILGPQVEVLEREMANYCGRRFAVGVASGTDALTLALCACEIGPGTEVLVPSFSFVATASSVSLLGATPVFIDIEPRTFTIDPAKIAAKITSRTRAILPVHLYGQSADLDPLLEIAARNHLKMIEDNAQALGATYKGKRTGGLGELGCISFYPTKNLGGYGDGGMIVTDSEVLWQRLCSLRNHGMGKKYISERVGWNSRLDEFQAAILRVKLRHLEGWNAARRAHAARYDALLKNVPGVVTPAAAGWGEHVFHQYTVRVPRRDHVQRFLADRGIATAIYYPMPIHLQPVYAALGYRPGDLPESECAAAEVLSLPIYPELTDYQIERVARLLGDSASQ